MKTFCQIKQIYSNIIPVLKDNSRVLAKRRIMIVDDEPYNVLGMVTILKQLGFSKELDNLVDKAFNG